MAAMKLFEKQKSVDWEYDEEGDVLYLSFGPPSSAVGIDVGDGLVLRYDEVNKEVVGLTAYGLGQGLLKALRDNEKRGG